MVTGYQIKEKQMNEKVVQGTEPKEVRLKRMEAKNQELFDTMTEIFTAILKDIQDVRRDTASDRVRIDIIEERGRPTNE